MCVCGFGFLFRFCLFICFLLKLIYLHVACETDTGEKNLLWLHRSLTIVARFCSQITLANGASQIFASSFQHTVLHLF